MNAAMGHDQALSVHRLGSGASEDAIEPLLDLSNQVFNIDSSSSTTHHSSLEEWQRRLSLPNSILVYVTGSDPPSSTPTTTAEQTTTPPSSPPPPSSTPPSSSANAPIGFIFAYSKRDASLPCLTLHIWLAGVLQKARGSGVFAALMSEVEKYARAQRVKALSVCTFPEKFEKMFAILQKQGWEGVEWREEHHKVLMMKRLEES